jgi:hypothetical protein
MREEDPTGSAAGDPGNKNANGDHESLHPPTVAENKFSFDPPATPPNIQFKRSRRLAAGSLPAKQSVLRRGNVLLALAVVSVLLLAASSWVGVQAWRAAGELRAAAGLFAELQGKIEEGDLPGARSVLAGLQARTRAARDDTDGWLWGLSTRLPWAGGDLGAVRTVSDVLDRLSRDGLPALIDVADGLDPAKLSPKLGRIDPDVLNDAAPKIAQGLAVVRASRSRIAAIPTGGLASQLRSAVRDLSAGLAKAERVIATADRAARVLPTMLGADTPRNYLLLFQNLAEVRATGGMPGAFVVLSADQGAITIVDQGTTGTLEQFTDPVMDLGPEMDALYTDRPATYLQDVNLTPDFPTAAALARRMYRLKSGRNVDGVLATDPVALSYLLKAAGSVKMPKGEDLTAENAVRLLLSEAYAKYPDPEDQDEYFATAARATFETLLTGRSSPRDIIAQLARAAGERRLLVWSADEREEEVLRGTVLAGQLPADDGTAPTVGVFLNDGGGSKLSYYLTQTADLRAGACDDDGSRQLHLALTLGSTAPKSGLPGYVTGLALSGDPYTSRTNVMIFSPTGGGVVGATTNGKEVELGTGIERDRGVGIITADLGPGENRTYDVILQTAPLAADAPIRPRLRTTPGVRPSRTTVHESAGCPG